MLLEQANNDEITGLAYLVESGNGSHSYGMVGDYLESPEKVFVPAAKGMFALCVHINEQGRKV
ncbi:hypothetical protein D9M73_90670 [compost metagenome]|nr:MAG TPA: hypothetical protein [Caudoviricetes sp.]